MMSHDTPDGARFRRMAYADLEQVMAIEEKAYPYPWTAPVFTDCIRVGYECHVWDDHGNIEAYGIMSVAAGECHILNICVGPERQACGLGRRVLEHFLATARRRGAKTAFLEVRPSNTPALQLYCAAGFCEVGLRKDYYPDATGREDALILAREL